MQAKGCCPHGMAQLCLPASGSSKVVACLHRLNVRDQGPRQEDAKYLETKGLRGSSHQHQGPEGMVERVAHTAHHAHTCPRLRTESSTWAPAEGDQPTVKTKEPRVCFARSQEPQRGKQQHRRSTRDALACPQHDPACPRLQTTTCFVPWVKPEMTGSLTGSDSQNKI